MDEELSLEDKAVQLMTSVFSTPNGQELLEQLKEVYVDSTCIEEQEPHKVFYRLGQKELVQMFLNNTGV